MKHKISFLILITILVGSNICSQQVYFNNRYDLYSVGSWDAVDNCIEVADGYIVSGGTGHPLNYSWHVIAFTLLNTNGEIIWTKLLGDTLAQYYNGYPGSLIQLIDGNYCFGGGKRYFGDTIKDVAIICKLDQNLDTLWLKEYGNTDNIIDTVNIGNQVKELNNSDLILVGSQYYYGIISKHLLICTDSMGNKLWEKTYGSTGISLAYSVIQTTDGGFAIGGFWYVPGSTVYTGDPIVIKTDSLGNKEWQKNLGGPFQDSKGILCNSTNSNFAIASMYADSLVGIDHYYRRLHVSKCDIGGNMIWDKKYGESKTHNYLTNIRSLADGSFIISGLITTDFPHKSGWLMKLSADGDSLWYRLYDNLTGAMSENRLYDVIPTSDNGFLACGYVFPMQPDTGTQDAWVIKLDSMGCDTPGCATGVYIPIPQTVENEAFLLYPNPASSALNCRLQIASPAFGMADCRSSLFIYDMFGRKQEEIQITKGQKQVQIDVSSYSPGIYLAVLKNKKTILGQRKFVVR